MILDRLDQAARYVNLHPGFAAALEFLRSDRARALAPGRHEVDGARLFVNADRADGRGRRAARLEAHRAYIDIQLTVAGTEVIGWKPAAACRSPAAPYDAARDIQFFTDRPDAWLAVPAGAFAIFFPEDAHAPLAGRGPVAKLVAKVALDWTA